MNESKVRPPAPLFRLSEIRQGVIDADNADFMILLTEEDLRRWADPDDPIAIDFTNNPLGKVTPEPVSFRYLLERAVAVIYIGPEQQVKIIKDRGHVLHDSLVPAEFEELHYRGSAA